MPSDGGEKPTAAPRSWRERQRPTVKAKGTVPPGWRYREPGSSPTWALARHGGTRSAKRGRGHLHARCSPSHRSSVHCLVFLRTPTPDPLYMPPPAPHHLRLAPSRPPTSASRGPDPFVLPSAVDPSSAPPPPIADPFLGEPPFAPPFAISRAGVLRVAVHLGSLFSKWMYLSVTLINGCCARAALFFPPLSLHCSLDCALGVVLFAVEKFGAGDVGGRWIRWAAGF